MSEVVCISSDSEGDSEFEKDLMKAKRRSLLDRNGKVMLVFNTVWPASQGIEDLIELTAIIVIILTI